VIATRNRRDRAALICGRTGCLSPHSVLAREDALHDGNHRVVFVRAFGSIRSILVCADDMGEQFPGVLFAEDFAIRQGEEKRFTYAERSCAIGIWKAYMFGYGGALNGSSQHIG